MFAEGIAAVATEFAQELAFLPPAEQRKHRMRIRALTTAASNIQDGVPRDLDAIPGFRLPAELRQTRN
ncbi:hypothetical protein [Rhodopila sp.]|uniref:hypothetical protein n=1 Tax=Rhodopila sp. TaxID=2480087 RepID=UPI002BE74547|nr:hypothetical protein [Rhodopila sp.]HVZ07170.1 hypothetical protein [Rhodopila sp.]